MLSYVCNQGHCTTIAVSADIWGPTCRGARKGYLWFRFRTKDILYVLVNSWPLPTVFRSKHRVTPNWFLRWAQKCLKTALRVANALLSQLANLYRTWFQIYAQNYIPVGSSKKVNSPHTTSWRQRRAVEVYLNCPNTVSLPLYLREEPGTQGQSGRVLTKRQYLVPPRIELRIFQPVVSHHTDYPILE